MSAKLLTEQHLEFLYLKGGCTGLSESTLVKMPLCWKSRHSSIIVIDFHHFLVIYLALTVVLPISYTVQSIFLSFVWCQ